MAYLDIADWKGNQYQKGSHILPYFRAQVALSERFNIVFGNLYGAANHRLIEPLYNPDLNLRLTVTFRFQSVRYGFLGKLAELHF